MREYVSEAVVLGKEPLRDLDGRYFFFTKRFGKVTGKATSARKITSKLAGHLEPGTLAQVRFIERNGGGTQIADALKYGKLGGISLIDLELLSRMLIEGEADVDLWEELTHGAFSWRNALRALGWDPRGAACEVCGRKAAAFSVSKQEFFCTACASKLGEDTLLLLGDGKV